MPISRAGAAAEGRRDRGRRRGGRRDRDGAGVRPRGRRAGAVRRRRRSRARRRPAPGARSRPRSCPGCSSCRRSRSAPSCFFGGRDVIGGTLTYGEFFLFYQLLLQLVWPLEALGWILSLAQRATASASRSFAWLQGIESIPEPDAADAPARQARLGVSFEDVHFSYGTGSEVLSRRRPRDRARRGDRGLRPDRRRQDVAAQPAAALLRPDRGPRAGRRRRRCAT